MKEPIYEINTKINHWGDCSPEGKIRINPKKGQVVNTIIHEQLHFKDWDMPHQDVYKKAKEIESKMSLPEQASLLMEIHQKSLNPVHERKIVHTKISKIISQTIK